MKWIGISSFAIDPKTGTKKRQGFSLTELAIVLAVVGLILGAIWEAAAGSKENSRQSIMKTNLYMIVKNVRAYAAIQNGVIGPLTTLTPKLVALIPPVIPGDLLRPNGTGGCTQTICADHPWGPKSAAVSAQGSLGICAWDPSTAACMTSLVNPSQFFSVELDTLATQTCMRVATDNTGADAPPGLYDVTINGTSIVTGAAVTHKLPPLASDVRKLCAAASPATVNLVYRVNAPQY